ncbi:MAG: hypothetical protein HYU84_08090 [Chloroflexi bacterium]|nr:hypothetical protein [Chloroflexota bacterium]MBI3169741.1 hypothetical protein [Chloroflexota bacterium]
MIEMLKRRVRPGTGSGASFILKRTAINFICDLRPILIELDWVLIGDVATRNYMPERMTRDLDILVRERDSDAVVAKLESAGYKRESQLSIPGVLMISPNDMEVDVLFGNTPWLEEALKNAITDPVGYPTIALPYLILLKMDAQRAQDWADVSRMLGWASDADLENVREAFRKYAPQDVEDLESLIFIGKKERETSDSDN